MKYSFFILVIFALTSCENRDTLNKEIKEILPPTNYSKIQYLFKDISPDSFYVFSDWSIDQIDFAFKGSIMDSSQILILPYGWIDHYAWNKDFGACYKFPLDSSTVGLIARVSGEYVSSALKLFIFDLQKDSITYTINLADVWGDAGESSVYSSCIIKDKTNSFLIVTYSGGSYDHRISDIENDTIVENWNYYALYKLKNNVLDTISKDSTEIVTRYPTIVNKLMKM